jgi:hypothetical protein
VHDVCVNAGTLYAAGYFGTIGGHERHGLVAIDPETGSVTSWDPNPILKYSPPIGYGLAVDGDVVYASGEWESIGGQPRANLAGLDAVTGSATAWDPGVAYGVAALAMYEDRLLTAGNFFDIGGQGRDNLAALDVTTATPTSWNPGLGGPAASLVVDGGTVFVAGYFLSVGSEPCSYLAAIDAASGEPLSWFPEVTLGFQGYPANAQAIAVDASRVYVGGDFRSVGLTPNAGFAALFKPATVGVDEPTLAESLRLSASPNPFTSASSLRFTLRQASEVRLGIYDVSGRRVRQLDQGRRAPGPHRFAWDGRDDRDHEVQAGIYFVKLTAGREQETARIVKLR